MKNFLITFAVSILIFGIIAFAIVSIALGAFSSGVTQNPENPIPQTEPIDNKKNPSGALSKSFNFLFINVDYRPDLYDDYVYDAGKKLGFDEGESTALPSYENTRLPLVLSALLVSVDGTKNRVMFSEIPTETRLKLNGKNISLSEYLYREGNNAFCDAIRNLTGLDIDYFALFTPSGLANVVDALGGINFNVPCEMLFLTNDEEAPVYTVHSGEQLLSGKDAALMLTYNDYADGNSYKLRVKTEFAKAVFAAFVTNIEKEKAVDFYTEQKGNFITDFATSDFAEDLDLLYTYENQEKAVVTYPGGETTVDGVKYFEPSTISAHEDYSEYKFVG